MKHRASVYAVAFSPDGKSLLTAGAAARLWDARTGARQGIKMKHNGIVYAATFSPDGRRVLTGSSSYDERLNQRGEAWLWDVTPPTEDGR